MNNLTALTMGDANGVGPEIVLKAYKQKELSDNFLVIGDYSVLKYCNDLLGFGVKIRPVEDTKINDFFQKEGLAILDARLLDQGDVHPGKISKKTAAASIAYVKTAVNLCRENRVKAMVTLPINKEGIRLTIPEFSGHTGYITELCGKKEGSLMLVSSKMVLTHISTHVSLLDAVKQVKKKRILEVINLTSAALKKMNLGQKIALPGLNPHAGENGAFGREELNEIIPAIETAKAGGLDVVGPFPPDVIFRDALAKKYDAVVCMYHDQGHIPAKLLDFKGAVNVTLGIDIVRTSVDHGTAFDIAWKKMAWTENLVAATKLAESLSKL